jgi:cyclopropane-fatty-acyl-phospholipid synthase
MNAIAATINAVERTPIPDGLTLMGIDYLCGAANKRLTPSPEFEAAFARDMGQHAVAENTDEANAQHYEVPAEFFNLALGPQRKYSCCLYLSPTDTLADAEENALAQTAEHADLKDGQDVLELGCGWGSLSLWMARRYPRSRIVSVSNSNSQRQFIEAEAAAAGLTNLTVITCDMNAFDADAALDSRRFDRVVSVEMFEHMSNWPELLGRVKRWMKPDGRMFMHVFTHRSTPYRFDHTDKTDWIAQHFFTGGVMPSHGLIRQFGGLFQVDQEWVWSGEHYRRTAMDWLANFDRNDARIRQIMADVYGPDAKLWRRRWRLFFLSVAGLFGHAGGSEWAVSHYRLIPTAEV